MSAKNLITRDALQGRSRINFSACAALEKKSLDLEAFLFQEL